MWPSLRVFFHLWTKPSCNLVYIRQRLTSASSFYLSLWLQDSQAKLDAFPFLSFFRKPSYLKTCKGIEVLQRRMSCVAITCPPSLHKCCLSISARPPGEEKNKRTSVWPPTPHSPPHFPWHNGLSLCQVRRGSVSKLGWAIVHCALGWWRWAHYKDLILGWNGMSFFGPKNVLLELFFKTREKKYNHPCTPHKTPFLHTVWFFALHSWLNF